MFKKQLYKYEKHFLLLKILHIGNQAVKSHLTICTKTDNNKKCCIIHATPAGGDVTV